MKMRGAWLIQPLLLGGLVLLLVPFGLYAAQFGLGGLQGRLPEPHYIAEARQPSLAGIYAHMLLGALVTVAAPLQLIGSLRRRFAGLHRWLGRCICLAALITGCAGLFYIGQTGTIGGWVMDAGFAFYGAFMVIAAVQTARFAVLRQIARHNAWALRLFWLILGSWLYRVHYGLWYLATGGLWSTPSFSGAFDLVQNFAFYLPYLIGLEIYLSRRRNRVAVN